jgi:hypothetical protein
MAQRANLIATYNANPTLQKQYTLPQYLALFDFGQTTTPTQTPTTTPTPTPTQTPTTPGIPNIINQNLNGGGRDGPQGGGKFGNLDMSKPKEFNIDGNIVTAYPNLQSGLYQDIDGLNVQNLGIGSFGIAPMIANALGLDTGETKYPGLFDKVSPSALIKNPGLFKSFFDRQDVAKQQKLQAEIDAANKAAAAAAEQARLNAAYQQQTITQQQAGGGGGGQFDGASSKAEYDSDPTGFSGSFQDGGRVYLYNRLK